MSHLAITQNLGVAFKQVVAHKFGVAFTHVHPVGGFGLCGVAGACLLLCHFGVKLFFAHGHAVFLENEFGEVEWESVGVVEGERLHTLNLSLAFLLGFGNDAFHHLDTGGKGAEERIFLFLDHVLNEVGLSRKFWISLAHRFDEGVNQAIHECFLEVEEGETVAHGTTQDAANHITSLGVAWELTVGYRECDGAHVVGNHTHCHVLFLRIAILHACNVTDGANHWLEHVGVVVALGALHHHAEAFEAHTGINHLCREWVE